jgi:ribonuclease-3
MEAILGAIYLDGGLPEARALIERSLTGRLTQLTEKTELKDPKTRLQEYLQARRLPLPEYEVTATLGDEHNQSFEVSCSVSGIEQPIVGTGSSRRKAEQAAARQALDALQ